MLHRSTSLRASLSPFLAAGRHRSPPRLPLTALLRRLSATKDGGGVEKVEERAKSTAQEFMKQAKEKADAAAEKAKEAMEDAKEKLGFENQPNAEEKLKEKVEEGKYDELD